MKKLLAMVLALMVVAVFFAACSVAPTETATSSAPAQAASSAAAAPAAESKAKFEGEIAYVTYYTTVPYWKDGLRGLEAAAKDLGIDFDRTKNFYGPTDGNAQQQAKVVEELVAKGVKGIIISPVDGNALIGPCKKAMDAGIPVICVINAVNDQSAYYAELGGKNFNVGVTGGNYIAKLIGEEGKVGILTIPGVPVHDERSQGYVDTFKNYPKITVLPLVNTDANPDTALQRASALIQANPDIKALIGTDSVGGAAAARAVKEAGKVGQIKVLGMDRDADLLGYIKEGVVTATVASKSFTTKWMAMHYMYWILNNKMMDTSDWKAAGINPVPKYTDTGNMIIDSSNIDIFLKDLETIDK